MTYQQRSYVRPKFWHILSLDESLVKEYHIDHHFKEVEELMREIKRLKELIASAGFKYYILNSEICADHDPSYTRR